MSFSNRLLLTTVLQGSHVGLMPQTVTLDVYLTIAESRCAAHASEPASGLFLPRPSLAAGSLVYGRGSAPLRKLNPLRSPLGPHFAPII